MPTPFQPILPNPEADVGRTSTLYTLQKVGENKLYAKEDGALDNYLIVSDIDGTLAVDHKHVTPRVRRVLNELMTAGNDFYVASGRMYNLAEQMAAEVGPQAKVIASNGAVYEVAGRRVHHLLGEAALTAAERATAAEALNAVFFSDSHVYYTRTPPAALEAALAMFVTDDAPIEVEKLFDEAGLLKKADAITNGLVLSMNDAGALQRTHDALTASALLHVSASDPTNIELIPHNVDKAHAVAELQAATGIPASRTIAFGDGLNDMGMLAQAGISVAMGNAVPEVKRAARYETLANTEDGVAVFLENWFA